MKISVGNNNVNFKPTVVDTLDDFIKYATTQNYSTGIFKDNYRNLNNFISADSIAIDVDNENDGDNYTIEDATNIFKDYKHIIMPSKSHRKAKHGKVADRFRIILFLDSTIDNTKDFTATWESINRIYPAADDSCKDASRYFYPSPDVYSKNPQGKLWKVVKYIKPEVEDIDIALDDDKEYGQLSKTTLNFLTYGAPAGKRNTALFKAAKDLHEQGFSKEQAIGKIKNMIKTTGNWSHDDLNDKDMGTIEQAYKNEPKYDKRDGAVHKTSSFKFKTIDELNENAGEINWVINDLLTEGGFSIIVGAPKSGKSTLMRQLAKSICRGEEFLGRKVEKGKVLYVALEEQDAVLKKQFAALGINGQDDILIHTGGLLDTNAIHDLKDAVLDYEPSIIIVDTLFLMAGVESINDYKEVNNMLAAYRELARQTNTHIITVHHQKKDGTRGTGSILGSTAIHGAVDAALIFSIDGQRRLLTTSQRDGIPFNNHELIFDPQTQSYKLGTERQNDGGF